MQDVVAPYLGRSYFYEVNFEPERLSGLHTPITFFAIEVVELFDRSRVGRFHDCRI